MVSNKLQVGKRHKQQATRGGPRPQALISNNVNVTNCRMPLGQNCRRHMFHVAGTRELGYCRNMNKSKKPHVRIAWGRDKDEVKLYVFETEEQKAFFLEGVEAAAGWLEYEIKD